MRVAYVSGHADMIGGGEHSLLDLMTYPTDVEAILITPRQGIFTEEAEQRGIVVQHLPMPKLGLKTLFVLITWVELLRDIKPDLIHANNSRAAFYAGLVGKVLNIPVIFHCRIAQSDGLMDKLLMRLVDTVICNSQAVAQRFDAMRLPATVIYNGLSYVKPDSSAVNIPSVERLMLFVGRLSREKQLDVALKVFAELAMQDAKLHFAIVGDDTTQDVAHADALRAWSKNQSWGSRVHWVGKQQHVAAWYKAADLLMLTSKHEGFGRVLVEAMAQGLPVVAFAVGGVPEVFEDRKQGVLVEPDDVDGMVKACQMILEDADLSASMGEAGKKRAQFFSLASHVAQVTEVYRKLLK